MNLRQRIRKDKINCKPWLIWKGEIRLLPISAQTLFSNNGIPIDILENELKQESYLHNDESLLDVLRSQENLHRNPHIHYDSDYGDFPEDWTEEDYIYYYETRKEII